MNKINLGISSCLLGEEVRYDGGHREECSLKEALGEYVRWVPVCPETDCGLPVPREPMELRGDPGSPRLVTRETGIDHTERIGRWTEAKLGDLQKEDLSGFIFKTRSPSCSCRACVELLDPLKRSAGRVRGLFAGAFMDRYPLIPVEDEESLADPEVREDFIRRIFAFNR